MTAMHPLNVQPIIERMRKAIAKRGWVRCPSCDGEWNKLHPCNFYWYDERGRHDETSYICVSCAESARGLMFCQRTWPTDKPIRAYVDWMGSAKNWDDVDAIDPETGKHYTERLMRWSQLVGKVVFASDEFSITTGRSLSQICVIENKSENPIIFDNIVAAWHWIKAKIDKKEEAKKTVETDEDQGFRRL